MVERDEPYAAEDFGMHRVIMRHAENRLIAAMLDAVYALAEAASRRHDARRDQPAPAAGSTWPNTRR